MPTRANNIFVWVINAALDRIIRAREEVGRVNFRPSSAQADRDHARSRFELQVNDFGIQWENVKKLIDKYHLTEIDEERVAQDEQWGGAKHDDNHKLGDFMSFIVKQAGKFAVGVNFNGIGYEDTADAKQRFIAVAALAIAALQWIDRRKEGVSSGPDTAATDR